MSRKRFLRSTRKNSKVYCKGGCGKIKRKPYNRPIVSDPYINLAGEIIKGVAYDYIKAIRSDDKQGQIDCENWFNSPDYSMYALGVPPDYVINLCHEVAFDMQ